MMASSREGYQAKQEGGTIDIDKFSKASSTSRQWSAFRNPRIVRVSRSFGGKDRHSKVFTIRGLRDRRIRLSVPTAIQLYDLQDKLGLSQPSKVIDWLLEATKLDIDKLPPLQFPQGFSQFHHQQTLLPHHHHESSASHHHQLSLGALYDGNSAFMRDGAYQNLMAKSRFWDMDSSISRLKGKELAERGGGGYMSEKGKWIKTNNEEENQDGVGGYNNSNSSSQVSTTTQRLFPMGTHNPLPGLLNSAIACNTFHSEPSSLSLSQFGSHGLFPSQVDLHPMSGSNGVQFPSSLPVGSVPSGSQLFFGPSSAAPQIFTPYAPFLTTPVVENDPRQFSHIQFLNSSPQVLTHPFIPSLHHSFNSPVRPFPTPFSSKLLESDNNSNNNNRSQPDEGSSARS